MKNSNQWKKTATLLCGEIGPEDGTDPRVLMRKKVQKDFKRKELQFCKETARTLSLVLAGEMNEPILRDLAVLSVTPEGDGSSLRITVGHHHSDGAVQEACVFRGLMAVQGYLRSTVAAAINRKHVPSLSFKYVGTIDEGTI